MKRSFNKQAGGITLIKRPIILVDLDDTLNKFAPSFWDVYNKTYNENQNYENVTSWNLQDFAREDADAYGLLRTPGFFRNLPLKDYAEEFMRNIYKKYDVYLVTDAPAGTSHCDVEAGEAYSNPADDKRKWVKEHFPYFPQDQIIFCSHKWMIEGDILVDDKPATYEKFEQLGKNCILIDMPYNRYIETKWRAKDLREAEQMIEEILAMNVVR